MQGKEQARPDAGGIRLAGQSMPPAGAQASRSDLDPKAAISRQAIPPDTRDGERASSHSDARLREGAEGQPGLPSEFADPLWRTLATPLGPSELHAPLAPASLDRIAAELVRRFSFSGRGKSGVVHLEFGEGVLAGAALTVECEGSNLTLTWDAPDQPHVLALAERIERRLKSKGLVVERSEFGALRGSLEVASQSGTLKPRNTA